MSAAAAESASSPLPTVQLLHTLPDGSSHIDWMIAPDPHGREQLITFRAPRPLHDVVEGDSIDLEHIGAHRTAYLSYEGPVSGDRGDVRRIAAGEVVAGRPEGESWRLVIRWRIVEPAGERRQAVRVQRVDGEWWRLECLARERQEAGV